VRRIIVTISVSAFIVIGCAGSATQPASSDRQCWTETISFESVDNFFQICIDESSVDSLVFFPNGESDPTICRQLGTAAMPGSGEVVLVLEEGPCDNGRTIGGQVLICDIAGPDTMTCTGDSEVEYGMTRETRDLYTMKGRSDLT